MLIILSLASVIFRPAKTSTIPSAELATLILEEVEVAAVPGEAFGPSGYLRFSYATSDADIVEGIGRIKKLITEG